MSILIPCYNAERWVAQAIESSLAQTWQDKEVIVIDDGSTDGSLQVIRSFEGRIRWETGPNRGGNVARNRLLTLATGEWLQYLDADDYLFPDKLTKQVDFLAAHPGTDLLFGPVTMEYWSEGETRRELLPIPQPHDPWVLLAHWYLPQTGATLWRRQAICDVGGWKSDQPCCQEHELYLRLLMRNKCFTYCEHSGAVYRQWGEHTVCKRNVPEVHRRRLEIEKRMEECLHKRGELTNERRNAINQARFETARIASQYDPEFAAHILEQVYASDAHFTPRGPSAPRHYRLAYSLVGFRGAEWLAKCSRKLFPIRAR